METMTTMNGALNAAARNIFALTQEAQQIFHMTIEDCFPTTTTVPVEINGTTYYIKMTVELHKVEEE